MKRHLYVLELLILFLIGGCLYYAIEVLWRGHSHWTMVILGGSCFLILGALNERYLDWEMNLLYQGIAGAFMVTICEFVAGCILNVWLGLHIWNYYDIPYNILGQICLPYSLLWIPLAIVAIVFDDFLRCWLFGEQRPCYRLGLRRRRNG